MLLQIAVSFEQFPAVIADTRSVVTVYYSVMFLQVAASNEAFVTQQTLVWFVSRVNSHVSGQSGQHTKRLVAYSTRVYSEVADMWQPLCTMGFAVTNQVTQSSEVFATSGTFQRFFSRMTSAMFRQSLVVAEAFSALRALVFSAVQIHVLSQVVLGRERFLALGTRVHLHFVVQFSVSAQIASIIELFATDGT